MRTEYHRKWERAIAAHDWYVEHDYEVSQILLTQDFVYYFNVGEQI